MKRLLLLLMAVVAGAATAMADDFVELLTNGACNGTYNGWMVTNGGSGWAIGQDVNDGSYFWASSYNECKLEQTVVLADKGFSSSDIDAKNVVCKASAMMIAMHHPDDSDFASKIANVTVEMQNDAGNVLSTITVVDDQGIFTEWTLFETDPFILVPGTRKLKFIVRGQDNLFWAGTYGPCFKNLSLMAKVNGDVNNPWGSNKGGWCGKTGVNGGMNVYYTITTNTENQEVLTISKNPDAVGTNCDIADYDWTQQIVQPWADVRFTDDGAYHVYKTPAHVVIEEGVTGIGKSCFYVHRLLTAVIPSTVTRIDANVFYANNYLTDVYCHADPNNLTWANTRSYDFMSGKQTGMHVYPEFLATYQQKFGDANVTFVGDLEKAHDCDTDGHEWGDWEMTTPPTCTENGILTRTCIYCDATETDFVPALGHIWNDEGLCSRCGIPSSIPDGMTMLSYICSDGRQAFNTGYIHKANTKVEMDCDVKKDHQSYWEALFGGRLGSYQTNAFCFFSRTDGRDIPCFNRSGNEPRGSGFVYGERIKIVASGKTATWYKATDPDNAAGSVTTSGTADDGKTPMLLFNLNTADEPGGVKIDTSPSVMKLYSFKIYEGDALLHHFMPAKKDGVVGLYDRITGNFSGSITDTPFLEDEITYPITLDQRGTHTNINCPSRAHEGDEIKFEIKYPEGTDFVSFNVKESGGNNIAHQLEDKGNRTKEVMFTMPASPVTITIAITPILITEIPSDYTVRTYSRRSTCFFERSWSVLYDSMIGKLSVGFGPNGKVYVQDLAWYFDNTHVCLEGTYDETTGIISIPTGQYLNWDTSEGNGAILLWGSTYLYLVDDYYYQLGGRIDQTVKAIELHVDGDNLYLLNTQGNLAADYPDNMAATGMLILGDDESTWYETEIASLNIKGKELPFASRIHEGPAIPADPVIKEWYDCGDDSGWSYLRYAMPYTDIKGNVIDPDLLSYSIFIDNGNGPELFTLKADVYSNSLSEDMTEIPFNFSGYDFNYDGVYIYRTNAEGYEPFFKKNLGIQVYYTVNDVRKQSGIVWLLDPDSIDEIKADENGTDGKTYNLAGQRLNKVQKGINIVNGKKVLVK